MTRKRYNVRLRLAATVVAAVLSLSGCTFQEMDRMSRKAQASGDIAREHVSEQMRSSQGALVWTDKPWVNLKPVPTVSRDTPLENFPDCQITLARDGLTLPEIGERITALCGVRVIFSPDALAVGQLTMRRHDGYVGAAQQHAAGRRHRGAGVGTDGQLPIGPRL